MFVSTIEKKIKEMFGIIRKRLGGDPFERFSSHRVLC